MKRKIIPIAMLASCIALLADTAAARFVMVNGQRLNTSEIQYLEQLSCNPIPDGRYWLDMRTGIWGYQGGGAQGHISDNCSTYRPGLSERGLLYSPGELLR